MKNIILLIASLLLVIGQLIAQDKILIKENTTLYIEDGASICTETIFVRTGGTLIAEDSSGVCPTANIFGNGTILIGSVLERVQLVSHSFIIIPGYEIRAVLKWRKTNDADFYKVEVWSDSTIGHFVWHGSTEDTSIVVSGLLVNKSYYWRAKGVNNEGSSVWSKTWNFTTTLVDINDENNLPTEFTLMQNHPNPFNPTTKINYSIPAIDNMGTNRVQLVIYDILGNKVATLVDEHKTPGSYTVEFEASGLSTGMYIYRLQSGSFTDVRKMILLK